MSMRHYGVDDYGMLFDEETMEIVVKALGCYEDGDKLDDMMWSLYDEGICEYISEFTGESVMLDNNGIGMWGTEENYRSDSICFYQLKQPSLFKCAYNGMDDVIAEIKENIGKYLPEDFDYQNRIRRITGTYFG